MLQKTIYKILVTFILLISPIIGVCDTLDYWHIFYNDSIIAKFNSTSQDLKIEISKSTIKENDTLTLRYRSDTPCTNCKFVLLVRDEKKIHLKRTETTTAWANLSFNFHELIQKGDKKKSKTYDFYYWEQSNNGKKTPIKLLLQITFKREKHIRQKSKR